jgi:hypothetical protein
VGGHDRGLWGRDHSWILMDTEMAAIVGA